MSELPNRIRLAPGDYFMHAQDLWMRRTGLQGNICCAIVRLDRGFDVERLRRRLNESPLMQWIARARLVRSLPLLPPSWQLSDLQPILFEHDDASASMPNAWTPPKVVAERQLHAERNPGIAFDVLRHADGTSHLFFSWNHTHLDAGGVDFVLHHLNSNGEANGELKDFISPKQIKGLPISKWWSNANFAHTSMKWLDESGKEPLFCPAPSGPREPGRNNHRRRIRFTEEETARIAERTAKIAPGFRRSHFYLAASLQALHKVALQRGTAGGAYLVPVPHDTRRHGAKGPIFSNHLSILFYRIETQQAEKARDIVAELGRQMTVQIRDKFPEACMAALNMFKVLPPEFYVKHLGKPTRGKIASLSFSDSGEACPGMTEFCGARILDVTHLIPCWSSPGVTMLFLQFANRLSIMLSWVDDCISMAEADSLERELRHVLLESEL
ncbi:MAG TPA: hypothetical protein VMF08_02730 [Candidatus Sulfotelmatobacter sp.]|nr:hypothetical protein [Candidatus Sulfotelmatobacter sp.]